MPKSKTDAYREGNCVIAKSRGNYRPRCLSYVDIYIQPWFLPCTEMIFMQKVICYDKALGSACDPSVSLVIPVLWIFKGKIF